MFGQHSPISPTVEFVDQMRALRSEVAELQRAFGVPRTNVGAATQTTNGSGDVTVTHGFGVTPTVVIVTPRGTSAVVRIEAKTATTFTVRFLNASFAAIASTSVGFDWAAFR